MRVEARASTTTLFIACLSMVLWLVVVSTLNPQPIADEQYHWPVIRGLCEGEWPAAGYLPMFPAYHLIIAALAWPFGAGLVACRAASALLGIVGAVLFCRARQSADRETSNSQIASTDPLAVLHFAWHPLLLPFSALVYTETAAVPLLLAAVYAQMRGRNVISAGLLGLACLVRQSNLVWAGLLAAWAVADKLRSESSAMGGIGDRPSFRIRVVASAAASSPYALLLFVATCVLLAKPDVLFLAREENRPRVNIAQFFLFALAVLVLWAPVWMLRVADVWRSFVRPKLGRPTFWASALAFAGLGGMALGDGHPWNNDLDYLRNWPLLWLSSSVAARVAVTLLIAMALPMIVKFTMSQPEPLKLGLVWAFSLLFLLPHWLVDPRYYIVPFVLLHLFTRFNPAESRLLAVWYAAISVAVAAFVVARGNVYGGIW